MTGYRIGWLALAVGLVLPAISLAGGPGSCSGSAGCPRATYSPIHYWAPALDRLYWHCHCPGLSVHAPPSPIPPRFLDLRFPCPPVDPATLPRHLALLNAASTTPAPRDTKPATPTTSGY